MITNELNQVCYSEFMGAQDASLFTIICLPKREGKFPTIIMRCPYVDQEEFRDIADIERDHLGGKKMWLDAGYAVVDQHCRGRGKSEGVFIPFVDERKDGLALQDWIRKQSFYNGELFLFGGSYTSSVHLATAPFADDIKGAVLEVMTTELYTAVYRNEIMSVGLHGIWFEGNYKNKQLRNKNINIDNFLTKPFKNYPLAVFGEESTEFMDIAQNYKEQDPMWQDKKGMGAYSGSLKHNRTPVLFTTGWYDIFVGGMIKMYNEMDEVAKNSVSLVVTPYDHSLNVASHPMPLKNGMITELVGGNYAFKWFEAIRNKEKLPLETGKVTYYKTFAEEWAIGDLNETGKMKLVNFNAKDYTYKYDPNNPIRGFKGGLSHNFGSTAIQELFKPDSGVISLYSEPFDEDVIIKGEIKINIPFISDCEDTGIYVRLYVTKPEGDYAFRDDVTKLSNFVPYYIPGEVANVKFNMEPHCIKIHKGEKIRLDITSSAFPQFLPHTNVRGEYYDIENSKIATNTVKCSGIELILPIE